MKERSITLGLKIASVLLLCVVIVFPVYWMLITSISPEINTFSATPRIIPIAFDLAGFDKLISAGNIFVWIRNSLLVAIPTAVLVVTVATISGYCLSRFHFKGLVPILLLLLLTQMLPEALLLLPIYVIYQHIHLLNSMFGLVLINAAFQIPIGTWILKNFFDTVPKELDEAACIDGCNKVSTLTRILIPTVLPSMAATAIIVFFEAWNEYLFAVTMVTENKKWVTSVGLSSFIGMYTVPVTQIMAGAILFTIPSLLIYIFCQKYIVSGLTSGSVKG